MIPCWALGAGAREENVLGLEEMPTYYQAEYESQRLNNRQANVFLSCMWRAMEALYLYYPQGS